MTDMQDDHLELWQQAIQCLHQMQTLSSERQQRQIAQLAEQQPAVHRMLQQLMRNQSSQSPLDRIPQQLLGLNVNLGTQKVGDYQLLEEISASVMGTVYRARRADGRYHQQVAIKLLAVSDNKEYHARFLSERQFLAKLEHPGITRIIDAGEFSDTTPYVVMEWVDGINITDYCAQHKLPFNARIKLFCKVCDAIHYAHQHLIVHGDIKPDNILVTPEGLPKLLDFGIAHRLDQISEHDHARQLFTTGYASPEQFKQQPTTTASDVFSLGLVLFELIYEQHAFAMTECFEDWQQQVCKQAPVLLSKSQQRQLGLSTHQQNDIKAICLCALEKQPQQRYSSVLALSTDLQRMLTHLPVSSHPSNWHYIGGKFLQRHTWATVSALLAFLITMISITVLSLQRTELRHALDNSEQQRITAEQTSRYIKDIMLQADPLTNDDKEISLDQVMINGADQLDDLFADQPEIKANLAYTLGQVLYNLGRYEKAIETYEMVLGAPNNAYRAQALSAQATTLLKLDRFAAAWDKSNQADLLLQTEQNLEWAKNRFVQVSILTEQSQFQKAAELMEQTLTVAQQLPINLTLDKLIALGNLYWSQDQLETALVSYQRGYNLAKENFGVHHHQTARLQYAVAVTVHRLGRFKDAQAAYTQALNIYQNIYGDDHPTTIRTRDALGALLYDIGDSRSAAPILEENLRGLRSLQPIDKAQLNMTLSNYALVLHDLGEFEQATQIYQEIQAISLEFYGKSSRDYASNLSNLGLLHLDQQQANLAMPLLEQSYQLFQALFDSNHQALSFSQLHFARAYWQLKQPQLAKQWLQMAIDSRRQFANGQHSLLADALIWQTRFAVAEQQWQLARQAVSEAVDIRQANFDADNWRVHEAQILSGLVQMLSQADHDNALLQAQQAYRAIINKRGYNDWRVQRLRNDIAPVLSILEADFIHPSH